MRFQLLVVITSLVVALHPSAGQTPAPASAPDADTAAAVERGGKYVEAFQNEFSLIVCEEHQIQQVVKADGRISKTRDTRSDVAFVKVGTTWPQPFRDVIEVDRKPVRNRDDRLRKLFLESAKTAVAQAQAIAQESRRYNIGTPRQGASAMLLLIILQPKIASGFHFSLSASTLAFDEFHTPSLLQYKRGTTHFNLMSRGSFVIDRDSGRVLSAELTAGPPAPVSVSMSIDYREDPQVKVLVPVEMRERYWEPAKPKDDETKVVSTFSNFRKFQVKVDDRIK